MRAPNGLAHLLNRDDDTNHNNARQRVKLEVRNCFLDTLRENGRYYQIYPGGICLFPCDWSEHERQDLLQHCLSGILLQQLAPSQQPDVPTQDPFKADLIAPCRRPGRVLDVGCGTGLWALDIAERYPDIVVEGIDIVGAQPEPCPNNIWRTSKPGHGRAIDFDQVYWHEISQSTYNLVHASHLCGSVSSWDALVANIYRSLTAGGWFESMEIDYEPCCDDGTLPGDSALYTWWHHMRRATAAKQIEYPAQLPQILRRAGFTDVQGITFPIPLNSWAADQGAQASRWIQDIVTQVVPDRQLLQLPPANWANRVKQLGKYMKAVLTNEPVFSPSDMFDGLSMAPLTRNLHWQKGQVDALVSDLTACSANTSYHAYFKLHIVIARKPDR